MNLTSLFGKNLTENICKRKECGKVTYANYKTNYCSPKCSGLAKADYYHSLNDVDRVRHIEHMGWNRKRKMAIGIDN